MRFTIASSEKSPFATNGPGFLALSPDGRRLAFVATTEGKSQLWVRALDSLTPQLLPGTDDAWQPTWSPDGRHVLFTASVGTGQLKKADVAGGTPVTLSAWANYTAAWSTAGVIVFTGLDDRLYRIPDSGGQPVPATELDKSRQETSHVWPIFLSDGRRFIFLARSSDPSRNALYLASLDSPSRTHLVDVASSVAYSAGHLIYQRDGTLMAQPFDERSGRVIGDAAPMIEGIEYNPIHGRAAFSVSANGTLTTARADRRRPRRSPGSIVWAGAWALSANQGPIGLLGCRATAGGSPSAKATLAGSTSGPSTSSARCQPD